jgi:hypothetical protein
MPDVTLCPRCDEPRPYDLRGSCRVCGTKIAPNAAPPAPRLDIPRSWGELWPTLLFSGILLAGGLALLGAAVFAYKHFPTDSEKIAFVLGFFGLGLVVCAGKCWVK